MDGVKNLHQQLVGGQDETIHSTVLRRGYESALSRLPVEVLCQIFVLCLPAETRHFRISSKLAPILLTRICRRWREVAVTTPSLWCRLYVNILSDREDWRKTTLCYGLWLQWSRECPLSLAIHCSQNGAAKLQRLLQPYKTQITSLQLLSEDAAIAAELLLPDLPALQKLKLQWRDSRDDEVATV
ncbi:hypothetical protein K503DRAFT_747560 [Rhizopogon vinicolor AM-OR11-026]|uniref:F-box domain-containing protein n=1 Tax=Rhizopogon vinicolor AM-OR11-026 TaxID=1314800 RepID=A0A1B7MP52_9AGAM|nr:hypothetical protein K503DRAFT_747560 [Rhizopogon vinicolor AM-OR11-026]